MAMCSSARGDVVMLWLILQFIAILCNCGQLVRPQQAILPGSWKLLIQNSGVSAMHMTLTHQNTVIMFDRADYGPSQLKLPNGKCRNDPNDLALKVDCYAHSIEYTIASNSIRPLKVFTDMWCSSGGYTSNGTLISTGGFNDGAQAVRCLSPCATCDWKEAFPKLAAARWYASNQVLPDGSMAVVGGRRAFSYEFVPSKGGAMPLALLAQTNVPGVENNLYPFVLLSSDGNLFVFANKNSILLDYKSNKVVKTFPAMPGGGGRNYPSSGSAVLLPLSSANNFQRVEVMICGGSPDGSFQKAGNGVQVTALQTCGRMVITDARPTWAMESMPTPRVMGDMLILPNGEVLIINGAKTGAAGWGNAMNPNLAPVLYRPDVSAGRRFSQLAPSHIPRLYHSTANVLPDGRVLVGGSNPNVGYKFSRVPFPTELRLEAYSPYYLHARYAALRPAVRTLSKAAFGYGVVVTASFSVSMLGKAIQFHLYAPPFTTHTFSMNQRQLLLASTPPVRAAKRLFSATFTSPPSPLSAPAGYYLLFVVNSGIPSAGAWVKLG